MWGGEPWIQWGTCWLRTSQGSESGECSLVSSALTFPPPQRRQWVWPLHHPAFCESEQGPHWDTAGSRFPQSKHFQIPVCLLWLSICLTVCLCIILNSICRHEPILRIPATQEDFQRGRGRKQTLKSWNGNELQVQCKWNSCLSIWFSLLPRIPAASTRRPFRLHHRHPKSTLPPDPVSTRETT